MEEHHQNNPLVAVGFLGSLGSGLLASIDASSLSANSLIPLAGIVASVVMPVLVERIRASKALIVATERATALQHQVDEMRSAAALQRQIDEMRAASLAVATAAAAASNTARITDISKAVTA
jgi:hypothetical protein